MGTALRLATAVLATFVLVELGLRAWFAWSDEIPPHPDFAVGDEWDWARKHLREGEAVTWGYAEHHPRLGWVVAPGFLGAEEGPGGRARTPVDLARRPGVPRIVLVGDSFTQQMERAGDALLPGWEVVNLGVPGYGAGQTLLRHLEDGVRWRADVVLYGFYLRDYHRMLSHFRNYLKPTFSVGPEGALQVGNVPVMSPEALLEAYRSGERRIGGGWRSVFLDYLGNRLSLYRAHGAVYDEEWRVMAAILRRFAESVREAGACPLLVIFPTRPEDYHGTVFEEIDRRARREADALDLPWLALAERLYDPERPGDGERWFQEGSGGHLSDEGIAVAAEEIRAAVEGLGCAGRRAGAQAGGSPRPASSPVR